MERNFFFFFRKHDRVRKKCDQGIVRRDWVQHIQGGMAVDRVLSCRSLNPVCAICGAECVTLPFWPSVPDSKILLANFIAFLCFFLFCLLRIFVLCLFVWRENVHNCSLILKGVTLVSTHQALY